MNRYAHKPVDSSLLIRAAVLSLGVLVAVVDSAPRIMGFTSPMVSATNAAVPAPVKSRLSSESTVQRPFPAQMRDNPSLGRDPFDSPLVRAQAAPSAPVTVVQTDPKSLEVEARKQLTLSGVMLGATRAAMINGKLCHEGDTIASYRLTRIESDGVVVEKEGLIVTLRMR